MIRCPKCGHQNQDGSRFCNACGTMLQRTRIRCPHCGTLNTIGNLFCDKCHTRLIPPEKTIPPEPVKPAETTEARLKGISLPARSAPAEVEMQEEELPEWLRGLDYEPQQPEEPATRRQASGEGVAPSDLPDWLSTLSGDTSPTPHAVAEESTEAEMLPDWLTDIPGDDAIRETGKTDVEKEELPDWLSGLLDQSPGITESQPAAATPEMSDSDLPDWMSGLTEEETDEGEGDLPDWLSGTWDSTQKQTSEASDKYRDDYTRDEETIPTSETLPDWALREPEAYGTVTPDNLALPDWLMVDADTAQPSPRDYAPPPLPHWLASVADDVMPGTSYGSSSLPPWLLRYADEKDVNLQPQTPTRMPPKPVDTARETQGKVSPISAPVSTEPTVSEEEEIPDWMSTLLSEAESPAAPPDEEIEEPEGATQLLFTRPIAEQAEEELPDWLSGILPAEDVSPVESKATQEGLPDWLSGFSDVDFPADETTSSSPMEAYTPPPRVEKTGLTGWLTTLPYEGELSPEPTETEEEAKSLPEGLPDWLSGVLPTEAGAEAAVTDKTGQARTSESVDKTGLTNWLSTLPEEPVTTEAEVNITAELPSWLSETEEKTIDTEGEVFTEDVLEAIPALEEDEIPDWLADVTPAPTIATQLVAVEREPTEEEEEEPELPDWLADLTGVDSGIPTEADQISQPPTVSSVFKSDADIRVKPTPSPVEAEVPDWLKDIVTPQDTQQQWQETTPEIPSRHRTTAHPPASGTPGTSPFAEDELEVPLLKKVSRGEGDTSFERGAPYGDGAALLAEDQELSAEGAEIPNWLDELTPIPGVPGTAPSPLPGDENLVRADLPGWLQQLQPPGTGPLKPPPGFDLEQLPSEEESGLAPADIPDWVKDLKPIGPPSGGVQVRPVITGPVEQQGPLAGLAGTLQAAVSIDIPAMFQPEPSAEIPEKIFTQAQLWQELLEQPYNVERPVAQTYSRSQAGTTILRLVVLVTLLMATFAAIFNWNLVEKLPQAPSHTGISQLVSTIDDLQENETVILAIEYGAAEAKEMTPITQVLLTHLNDRKVQVLAVSTLPDGVGLAEELLARHSEMARQSESASLTQTHPTGQTATYLPGSVNSIAGFLATAEAQNAELLIVLSARPDRLRWWIEQNANTQPMGVGVSAASGPLIAPYLEAKGVKGWLVGFTDAVAYNETRGIRDSNYSSRLGTLMLVHWITLAFLIFGLCYSLVAGKRR
ncbi:MAG: zinc ribbon domain-containing protein [Anaerolineae bacterium]|nr:zinc ribbon domain-containing protein [Anaerolineae bacterium]